MRAELKEALEGAARAVGRSQSQEAEFRLEASFEKSNLLREALELAYGSELAGVLLMIGMTMREVGPTAAFLRDMSLEARAEWLSDPYAFDQAVQAINRILEVMRPPGESQPPTTVATVFGDQADAWGEGFANSTLDAVAGRGATAMLKKEGSQIAELLGPLAKRAKGWAKNAR